MQNRRDFLAKTGLALAAAGVATPFSAAAAAPAKTSFIHHVYFWLNNPDSIADRNQLVAGLRTLTNIKGIQLHHIGVPAGTTRDVVERSYAVSWLLIFKDKESQDQYQVDPVHLDFVKNYSHLWKKVVVYDSVDV